MMLGDMLINDETMTLSMPLRSTLQLGLSATESQALEAVKELISGEPKLVPWQNSDGEKYSQVMVHKEYSGGIKEELSGIESRDFLVLVLGDDGNNVFRKVMNLSNSERRIEDELSSIIGSGILDVYSKNNQSSGFDRDSINVRVTYVRNQDMLEDIDFERYFGIAILESEKVSFGNELVEHFIESLEESNVVIPIVYSFSESVSRIISKLSESQASSIAASWLYSIGELEPTKQMDYLLHTFNKLFIEYDYGNTSSHAQSIMQQDYFHTKTDNSEIEALLSSCNLTTCGHNYFKRFVGEVIDCHKRAFQKVKQLILPTVFSRKENPRDARKEWLNETVEDLASELSQSDSLRTCTASLIGIHKNFSDINQWRGEFDSENPDEKLARWAAEISDIDKNQLTRYLIQDKNGKNFYGGSDEDRVRIGKIFTGCAIFDEFNNSTTQASNLHIRHWKFFKRLFNITNMFMYGIKADGLEPLYKQREQISSIDKIQSQIRKILLCELFLKFRKDGGVVR